jgi:hypothetical protein
MIVADKSTPFRLLVCRAARPGGSRAAVPQRSADSPYDETPLGQLPFAVKNEVVEEVGRYLSRNCHCSMQLSWCNKFALL